ncbi:MAG: alpha-ketoglutarate-dependent dioxygenase AlkB [Micavibrio sp.]|nr:alpha-ketoglutarate-dependent dioxygenase AlkB [Micavibrio sp.]
MLSLFPISHPIPEIDGLRYLPDFISEQEESIWVAAIDAAPWNTDIKRRVQIYGYSYDYSAGGGASRKIGALPGWLDELAQRLEQDGIFPQKPDQAIVNEYLPRQGIAPHIDRTNLFTDRVVSITLAAPVMMVLNHEGSGRAEEIWLERRSLLLLEGAARYDWQHGIAPRKNDVVGSIKIPRERRVSVTMRKTKESVEL